MNGKRDNMIHSQEGIERAVFDVLRLKGWILPRTPEEVLRAEKDLAERPVELPEGLADPFAVLDKPRGRIRIGGQPEKSRDTGLEKGLAQAAREGGEISAEIRERMRKDRKRSEREDE